MHRVLLIDDDQDLGPPLATYLRRFDLELQTAHSPSLGFQALAAGGIDAVILDVMLPEMDGFEVCRRLRAQPATATLPVLMLTARGELSDRVVGLELGADDYLPKPFEPRELAARLATILRRARQGGPTGTTPPGSATPAPAATGGPDALRFEGLVIDPQRRAVFCQGQAVELTGTEYELLLMLAREPQRVFSRDEILGRLRGRSAEDLFSRAVDILISRLRRKLEPLDCIKTLRNAGYTFAGARA
jgi:OmpR family response regulator RpaB